jgi:hypothetical protein
MKFSFVKDEAFPKTERLQGLFAPVVNEPSLSFSMSIAILKPVHINGFITMCLGSQPISTFKPILKQLQQLILKLFEYKL